MKHNNILNVKLGIRPASWIRLSATHHWKSPMGSSQLNCPLLLSPLFGACWVSPVHTPCLSVLMYTKISPARRFLSAWTPAGLLHSRPQLVPQATGQAALLHPLTADCCITTAWREVGYVGGGVAPHRKPMVWAWGWATVYGVNSYFTHLHLNWTNTIWQH